MTSAFKNEAAWIAAEKSNPLVVGPGPEPNPSDNEVVIKVAYAAINPIDWKVQDHGGIPVPYPFVFGTDVSGTVVKLGSSVNRFKIGQRVIGHCDGFLTQKATNGGFQTYSTCREILVAAVPDSLPLANAAVLPLSISTAATGLFVKSGLPLPSLAPKSNGKTVLIWGGSSSTGSSAIQLAVAAGSRVVTTASTVNHEYVQALGASVVFDHADPNVVAKIVEQLKPGDSVLDFIGSEQTQMTCGRILSQIGGGKLPVSLFPPAPMPENVEAVFILGLDVGINDLDVGDAVWRKYIPEALEAGKFQAKPDPLIINGGLGKIQEGINILRAGVSAKKIVVEIAQE